MTFDDETLMAYADGELDAPTRAAVETAMTADPTVAERVARHRALHSRLRSAFDPVLAEPLPERLLATARGATTPGRTARAIAVRRAPALRWSWPQFGALAASLVLGALLGPWVLRAPTSITTRDGALLAGGPLAHALSQQLASTQPAAAPIQIGVSFRSHTGDYCRTFVLREKGVLAGLACRDQGKWHLEALASSKATPETSGYREAASALPPVIARTVDALIAGEPLDAPAEAAARERGWSR